METQIATFKAWGKGIVWFTVADVIIRSITFTEILTTYFRQNQPPITSGNVMQLVDDPLNDHPLSGGKELFSFLALMAIVYAVPRIWGGIALQRGRPYSLWLTLASHALLALTCLLGIRFLDASPASLYNLAAILVQITIVAFCVKTLRQRVNPVRN